MALASEEEWESDPELKAMRRDFVASFTERRQVLEALAPRLANGRAGQEVFEQAVAEVLRVVHKLAGAAETYGFPTLTRGCAALEERLDQCPPGECEAGEIAEAARLVGDLMARAQVLGKDPKDLDSDERMIRLLGRLRS
jgi:HPt (histidine-containing phosphotransfer) domain-containing protein